MTVPGRSSLSSVQRQSGAAIWLLAAVLLATSACTEAFGWPLSDAQGMQLLDVVSACYHVLTLTPNCPKASTLSAAGTEEPLMAVADLHGDLKQVSSVVTAFRGSAVNRTPS